MAKNQRNITLASYNYLYEVQAIPQNVRSAYLNMLLKQKGKEHQKRVLVLKMIYSYVDDNTISRWNPQIICNSLGISKDMLYCYKSRLLKGLRELYFNWPQEEKKIEEKFNHSCKNDTNEELPNLDVRMNEIKMNFAKARKMAELGMMREAKSMYLKLLKPVMQLYNIEITRMNLMKTEIFEFMVYYYYNRRKKNKLKYYNNKLQRTYRSVKILNRQITDSEKMLFEIRENYSDFYLNMLDWYKNGCVNLKGNNIEEVYKTAKQGDYINYLYMSLRHKAVLRITENNFESAAVFCLEGFELARKESNIPVTYAFASMLHFLRSKIRVPGVRFSYEDILGYYRKAKETIPLNVWTVYLENSISMILYPEILNKAPEVLKEQANTNIMLGDLSLAIYWKFIYSSEYYIKNLISHFVYDQGNLLEMNTVSPVISDEIDNTCFNTLCYHKASSDLKILPDVYKLQLTVSFFREQEFDSGYCRHIINKILRLQDKKDTDTRLELLILALKMLENSEHPKIITNKFEHKFKKQIERFKENITTFNLLDYAIISSLARRLRCREITAIVKDLYHWLETHHPEILAPALREIQERASKVKLIDGSKQSAA